VATVLVVDDEPDIQELVRINLELDGHRVVVAGDGAAALDAVSEEVPDVVLLDVMMPGVDGWTVLEQIKAAVEPEIKTIPVLMLTAFGGEENRVRGGIEGAIRYLTKPVSPDQLRREVRQALEGEPEPLKRRRVQKAALEDLARIERGGPRPPAQTEPAPRPRLTRLERSPAPPPETPQVRVARDRIGDLTAKQRQLLEALRKAPSVSSAATELAMSRSNVYASLRRISRKLGTNSVPELLVLVRDGAIFESPSG
jgi:DNA-binding response OmpR family regulator